MQTAIDERIALHVPESMKAEHAELHEELFAATQAPGEVGEAARSVAEVLHAHFEKEEAFALPPLGLLPDLARGETGPELEQALQLTERLEADLPEMLAEHKEIVAALDNLRRAAEQTGELRYVSFAEKLKAHALTEEQVSYPAAILIGRYIKLVLGK